MAPYPRDMRFSRSVAIAAGVIGIYAVVVRPRLLRSGASPEELRQPYPGGDLIPDGTRGATMAVTIEAPPRQVWPWLVQMGHDRAGWYSWDYLDHLGVTSADRIHPEWQHISVGDRLASTPDGRHWFEVAALEPERFLALRASFDFRGRQFASSSGLRPPAYTDSTWCFLLEELPAERTRLIVSGYASARPRPVQALASFLFWEPAHWIMQKRQFTNLKQRVERELVGRGSGPGPSPRAVRLTVRPVQPPPARG
jgi:hypothetical protein